MALKKTYSSLGQAFNRLSNYIFDEDYRNWDYTHSDEFTKKVYKDLSNNMNIIKVCGKTYVNNECFHYVKAKNGQPALFFDTNGFKANFGNLYTFVLNDGTSVALDIWTSGSLSNYAGVNKNLINEGHNLIILADVNGVKPPNTAGKDVHMFVLTDKGVMPAGADNNSANCNNKKVSYNYDCTAQVIK